MQESVHLLMGRRFPDDVGLFGKDPQVVPALLEAHECYLVSEDRVLQANALQILPGRRRHENRLPSLKINRITRTVPFRELSPSFRLLNEGDVVFTAALPVRIYFRFLEITGFGTPSFEQSPLLA